MYYLHLLDGTRHHRSSVVWVSSEAASPHIEHHVGDSPLIDRDGNAQFYDTRWTLGPVTTAAEAKTLAITIAERYNYLASFDGRIMDTRDWRKSLAGASLGSTKSDAKADAARANGKKGGRPRKKVT